MKRVAIAALMVLALAGCASSPQRPEGVVERWLLALNQGSAGRAGRYADASTSRQILPNYSRADPGELDVIEVGTARHVECSIEVPFRVVTVAGDERSGYAVIQACPTTPITPIAGVRLESVAQEMFPSEGVHAFGSSGTVAWAMAAGIGFVILLVGEGAMRLVRRRARG